MFMFSFKSLNIFVMAVFKSLSVNYIFLDVLGVFTLTGISPVIGHTSMLLQVSSNFLLDARHC